MNNKGKAKAIREFYAKNQTSNVIKEMKVNIKELNNRLSTIKDINKIILKISRIIVILLCFT